MLQNNFKNYRITTNRGLIRTIIIIVIAILILSYYGFSLRKTVQSPTTQDNFSYAWGGVVYVWDNYLKNPADEAYNFFITYIWTPAIGKIESNAAQQAANKTSAQ